MGRRHIYLTGFMGAGKTTVGSTLADKLSRPFVDTDSAIQTKARKSISDIFSESGEAVFRQIESEVIQEVSKMTPAVIALGGGALKVPSNRQTIGNTGWSIYLKWEIELLLARISADPARPLVTGMTRNKLIELYLARESFYELADVVIRCEGYMTPETISSQIVRAMKEPQ